MADLSQQLAAEGIRLRSYRLGNHKLPCPRCSASRKKKTEPCLSVTVFDDRAKWDCHHCQWTGGVGGSDIHLRHR